MIGFTTVGTNDGNRALALGATDEGPPGDRGDNYYGAYFRDLDGNKLNVHCWT
jgi:predicted lactoylglutathione lyase